MKETKWKRTCPSCGVETAHTTKCNRDRLERDRKVCRKCGAKKAGETQKGRSVSNEVRERISNSMKERTKIHGHHMKGKPFPIEYAELGWEKNKGVPKSEETKRKISKANGGEKNGMYGKTHSDEYKQILSEKLKKEPLKVTSEGIKKMTNSLIGKTHSDDTRRKMRESHNKRMLESGICPMHNPAACKYLDNLSTKMGWKLKHAMNGGETHVIGYFIDAYDVSENIVVEYDEPHHYTLGQLKEKDIIRMNEIKNHLNCRFFRYDEKRNKLTEF